MSTKHLFTSALRLVLTGLCLMGAGLHAWGACPSWPTASRFSQSGEEVTDLRTGLIWARCSFGQTWRGGRCTGKPLLFTHEQALKHAATVEGWRLPTRRELFGLVDTQCSSPAIDTAAFPDTPAQLLYWTSTPALPELGKLAYDPSQAGVKAWAISFREGAVGRIDRTSNPRGVATRLVRATASCVGMSKNTCVSSEDEASFRMFKEEAQSHPPRMVE